MPEISLRDYLNKLENALFAGSADEVIHHSRHILQFYPKNVAAYRYLGRALVHNARWEEGSAALRRILSVIPDDYTAHLGLSEAYDGLKRGDSAIWHLERAFEQQPNNRDLIEGVRAMYRRYRAVEPKIGLTSAAVARQHLANRRFDQAIETLRGAVSRAPDRVDLKVMLAQVLWQTGDQVGGAESALDVLEVLPDCMEANVILTRLWLGEDRPSDAQRYLSRVESVDPYRALEIAQGDAPDDAFRLEELDYQRFAKSEASNAKPDWLKQVTHENSSFAAAVDSGAEQAETDWNQWSSGMLSSAAASAPSPEPINFGFDEESEVPDFDPFAVPTSQPVSDSQTQMPSIADDPMAWLRAAGVEVHDDEPAAVIYDDDDFDASSPTAWMSDHDDEVISVERTAPASDSDPMAWMPEPPDTDGFNWIADDEIALPSAPAESDAPVQADLSWMQDESGILNDAIAMEQLSAPEPVAPEVSDQQFDQLFPDLELLTSDVTPESLGEVEDASFNFEFEFEPADTAEKEETSTPDWMHASEFDDDAPEEAVSAGEVPEWMRDASSSGYFDEARAEQTNLPAPVYFDEPTAVSPPPDVDEKPRTGLTGLLNSANLDWLKKTAEPEPEPSDAWMAMFDQQPPTSESVTETPAWLLSIDDEQDAAPASQPPSAEMEFDMPSDKDFDWMSQSTPEDAEHSEDQQEGDAEEPSFALEPAEVALPDWFSAVEGEEQPEPVSGALEPDDLPEWLTDLQSGERLDRDEQAAAVPEEPAAAGGYDWSSVEATESPESTISAAAQPIGDDFSAWLTGINDEFKDEAETLGLSEEEEAAAAAEEAESEFATFELDESEAEPLSGELPEWLSELQPEAPAAEMEDIEADPLMPDTSLDITDDLLPLGLGAVEDEPTPLGEAVPAAESDLSWLTEVISEAHEDDVAQDIGAVTGEPDTIFATNSEWATDDLAASVGPQSSIVDLDDEFADEFADEFDDEFEVEFDEAVANEVAELEAPLIADLSFLTSDEVEVPEGEPASGDLPEWLVEMQPEPENQSDTLPLKSESGVNITEELLPIGMGAMEHEPGPLDEPELAGDELEWLTEAGDAEGHEGDVAKDFGTEEDHDESDRVFARNSEWATDDLAASVGPQSSVTNYDDEPAAEFAQFSGEEIGGAAAEPIGYAEETEAMPVEENVPDWLNAMVPGIDIDYDIEEDEPIEQEFVEEPALIQPDSSSAAALADNDEFQWLTDIVDEETREIVPDAPPALPELPGASATADKPRFSFTRRPEWLKFSKTPAWAKQSPAPENPPAANSQDDFPDWIDDDPDRNNDLPEWLK